MSTLRHGPRGAGWRQNKPLRFGRNRDADVQQFLAQGVRIMDDFNEKMPLGLRDTHRQVRNRCNELARGMEKVLAKRPDEEFQFDPRYASWRHVEIYAETAPIKGRSPARVVRRRHAAEVPGGLKPGVSARAGAGGAGKGCLSRLGRKCRASSAANPPIAEAAKPWKRFLDSVDAMRMRDGHRGAVWGYVDPVNGIDFRPALTQPPRNQFKTRG